MNFADLFCGIGGSSYGAMEAGLTPKLLVDNDNTCKTALNATLAEFFQSADLSRLTDDLLQSFVGIDVLLCSPPCQSYSSLRTRNRPASLNENDRAFVASILSCTDVANARLIVVENVPAFLKSNMCGELVSGFLRQGYSINAGVMDAAQMGVPQRRKRAIVTASRKEHLLRATLRRLTVRDAFADLPPIGSYDPLHDQHRRHSELVRHRISLIPKDGGSRSALPLEFQLDCHKNSNGFKDVYGRMYWNEPSPTITGGCTNPSKGRFLHPEENRAISLREAARLQTLPDSLTLGGIRSLEAKARMIGNAFPPAFIKQVIQQAL